MTRYCGKLAPSTGRPCRWRVSESACKNHDTPRGGGLTAREMREREQAPGPVAPTSAPAVIEKATPLAGGPPEAVVKRDVGEVCWLIVERALDDPGGDGRGAAVAVSALRILVGLPPAGQGAEAARKEAFLRGKIMHGIAPQYPEEWALAEAIFEEKAIEEFRRWELWERDDGYVDEPFGLGELARDEAQPPRVIDQQD